MRQLLLSFFIIILCSACHNDVASEQVYGQPITFSLIDWNDQHFGEVNLTSLESLYADDIIYYKKELPKAKVLKKKRDFIQKHTDFEQEVELDTMYKEDANTLMVKFHKGVNYGGRSFEVESYLKVNQQGLIEEEGELAFTENKRPNLANEDICHDIVFEILDSYADYGPGAFEIPEGNDHYGRMMENSPFMTIGSDYMIGIYENHEYHIANLERYFFDPISKELSFDEFGKKGAPLPYNKKLLVKFKKYCE